MHAYLIISRDQQLVDDKIRELNSDLKAEIVEFKLQKINEVRELVNYLKLSSKNRRTIIIKDFNKSSTEAMNAFLKNLEEPNPDVNYILISESLHGILPTILSRVNLIRLNDKNNLYKESDLALTFINKRISEKLKYIDKIKKREDALNFIEEFIFSGHKALISKKIDAKSSAFAIEQALVCKESLEKNGNINLHLSKFVILIDR